MANSAQAKLKRIRAVLRRLGLPASRNGQGPYDLLAKYLDQQAIPRNGQSNKNFAKAHVDRLFAEIKPAQQSRPARPAREQQQQVQHLNLYIGNIDPASPEFLQTAAWRQLRMLALKQHGARCQCCGASPSDSTTVLNVDHIKPRKTHPHLALQLNNLQILCKICNHGKGNWDDTDWRTKQPGRPKLGQVIINNHSTNETRIVLSKEQRHAIRHSITCPRCNAAPGMECTTKSGKPAPDHASRWTALIQTHGRLAELGSWIRSPELLERLVKLGTAPVPTPTLQPQAAAQHGSHLLTSNTQTVCESTNKQPVQGPGPVGLVAGLNGPPTRPTGPLALAFETARLRLAKR